MDDGFDCIGNFNKIAHMWKIFVKIGEEYSQSFNLGSVPETYGQLDEAIKNHSSFKTIKESLLFL